MRVLVYPQNDKFCQLSIVRSLRGLVDSNPSILPFPFDVVRDWKTYTYQQVEVGNHHGLKGIENH